jgi:transposase-like protein
LAALPQHFMRDLFTEVPQGRDRRCRVDVRNIFAQPDAEGVRAQRARTVEQLAPRYPQA